MQNLLVLLLLLLLRLLQLALLLKQSNLILPLLFKVVFQYFGSLLLQRLDLLASDLLVLSFLPLFVFLCLLNRLPTTRNLNWCACHAKSRGRFSLPWGSPLLSFKRTEPWFDILLAAIHIDKLAFFLVNPVRLQLLNLF